MSGMQQGVDGNASLKGRRWAAWAAAALAGLAAAIAHPNRQGGARVETIAREGTTWTASTWAYSTPKLLYDGRRTYAVGLVGSGPGHDVGRLYWREGGVWHRGADIQPIYQPATLLLDERGHINVFCTSHGGRAYHWRSARPGNVSAFVEIPIERPEQFRYGYLGVGRSGTTLVLAGLDGHYAMWLTVKPSFHSPWSPPYPLAPSQRTTAPWQSPVYPIVIPTGRIVHVVYSNCPDGGVHNTYNRVEYARFDLPERRVTRHDTVADGPVGEMTYGLDALRSQDGTLYVLYLAGLHAYGGPHEGSEARRGLWCAALRRGGTWATHRVTTSTGTSQLFQGGDGALHVFESGSQGTRRYTSRDGGRTWVDQGKAWDSPGGFLYVVKPNSGSRCDGVLRAVQSTIAAQTSPGGSPYGLEYIEMELPSP